MAACLLAPDLLISILAPDAGAVHRAPARQSTERVGELPVRAWRVSPASAERAEQQVVPCECRVADDLALPAELIALDLATVDYCILGTRHTILAWLGRDATTSTHQLGLALALPVRQGAIAPVALLAPLIQRVHSDCDAEAGHAGIYLLDGPRVVLVDRGIGRLTTYDLAADARPLCGALVPLLVLQLAPSRAVLCDTARSLLLAFPPPEQADGGARAASLLAASSVLPARATVFLGAPDACADWRCGELESACDECVPWVRARCIARCDASDACGPAVCVGLAEPAAVLAVAQFAGRNASSAPMHENPAQLVIWRDGLTAASCTIVAALGATSGSVALFRLSRSGIAPCGVIPAPGGACGLGSQLLAGTCDDSTGDALFLLTTGAAGVVPLLHRVRMPASAAVHESADSSAFESTGGARQAVFEALCARARDVRAALPRAAAAADEVSRIAHDVETALVAGASAAPAPARLFADLRLFARAAPAAAAAAPAAVDATASGGGAFTRAGDSSDTSEGGGRSAAVVVVCACLDSQLWLRVRPAPRALVAHVACERNDSPQSFALPCCALAPGAAGVFVLCISRRVLLGRRLSVHLCADMAASSSSSSLSSHGLVALRPLDAATLAAAPRTLPLAWFDAVESGLPGGLSQLAFRLSANCRVTDWRAWLGRALPQALAACEGVCVEFRVHAPGAGAPAGFRASCAVAGGGAVLVSASAEAHTAVLQLAVAAPSDGSAAVLAWAALASLPDGIACVPAVGESERLLEAAAACAQALRSGDRVEAERQAGVVCACLAL